MYLAFIHIGGYDIKARRHLASVQNDITQLWDWRMETWQLALQAHCHVSIRQSPSLCNAFLNTCPCLLAIQLSTVWDGELPWSNRKMGCRPRVMNSRPVNLCQQHVSCILCLVARRSPPIITTLGTNTRLKPSISFIQSSLVHARVWNIFINFNLYFRILAWHGFTAPSTKVTFTQLLLTIFNIFPWFRSKNSI